MKIEIKKALINGTAYDYICNHYWEMTKDDLKDICKEALFQCSEEQQKNIVEELEDYGEEWNDN